MTRARAAHAKKMQDENESCTRNEVSLELESPTGKIYGYGINKLGSPSHSLRYLDGGKVWKDRKEVGRDRLTWGEKAGRLRGWDEIMNEKRGRKGWLRVWRVRIRGRTLAERGRRETDNPRFTENKRKRVKNGEDDGVRLRISLGEGDSNWRKYMYARAWAEGKDKGSGSSVRGWECGSQRGKTRSEKLKKGQKIGRNFRRLRTCPRASFPPFKFRTFFSRYHFSR